MPDAVGQPDARPAAKHEPNPVARGGRFIYVEHSQRDSLWSLQPHDPIGTLSDLVAAWDAAPANPTEAAFDAAKHYCHDYGYEIADDVLAALGYPGTEAPA